MLPFLRDPELVFGLCSPIGTDNKKVRTLIRNELAKYAYTYEEFKVTDLMKTLRFDGGTLKETPLEERYDSYINYANKLRETYSDSGLLGMICCAAIRSYRRKINGVSDTPIRRHTYLFDQFKRKEEVEALRQVYGDLFILVSVYSSKRNRCDMLTKRISDSHSVSRSSEDHEAKAKTLVRRDEDEGHIPTGQRLSEIFPLADVFIDIDNEEEASKTISRFLQALFGSNAISPTISEYGMFLAKAASLRSLDLSRQVGAAILYERGDIVSLGCNEVPCFGGGQYWLGDSPDGRDHFRGNDENDRLKRSILADLLRRLMEEGDVTSQHDAEALVSAVLQKTLSAGNWTLLSTSSFPRLSDSIRSMGLEGNRCGRSLDFSTLMIG